VSLIEDARRIMHAGPPTYGEWQCAICQIDGRDRLTHNPECPWRSLPRIVAALEAAQSLVDETTIPLDCVTCFRPNGGHTPDCPWQALAEAMRDAP
jgi:hypothetical protein